MRTKVHTKLWKSPFELHFGRNAWQELDNFLVQQKLGHDFLKNLFNRTKFNIRGV